MEILIHSIEEINEAARVFVEAMGDSKIFAFYGGMGVGKTTFIKAICEQLKSSDSITSPTFAIVNEYLDGDERPIYHFDFYRIKDTTEALAIGLDDYVASGNVCLMEWPEVVENLLPDDTVKVYMEEQDDGSRIVRMENIG